MGIRFNSFGIAEIGLDMEWELFMVVRLGDTACCMDKIRQDRSALNVGLMFGIGIVYGEESRWMDRVPHLRQRVSV